MRDVLNEGQLAQSHIFSKESSSSFILRASSFPSLSSLLFRCAVVRSNPNNL